MAKTILKPAPTENEEFITLEWDSPAYRKFFGEDLINKSRRIPRTLSEKNKDTIREHIAETYGILDIYK